MLQLKSNPESSMIKTIHYVGFLGGELLWKCLALWVKGLHVVLTGLTCIPLLVEILSLGLQKEPQVSSLKHN